MTACCWFLEELCSELTWELIPTCFLGFSSRLCHGRRCWNEFLSTLCSQYVRLLLYVIHFWCKVPCDVLRWNVHLQKCLVWVLGRGEDSARGVCSGRWTCVLSFLSCPRRPLHLLQDDLGGCAGQDSRSSVIYWFCSISQAAFFSAVLVLWGQRKQRKENARRSDKTGVWLISSLSLSVVFFHRSKIN